MTGNELIDGIFSDLRDEHIELPPQGFSHVAKRGRSIRRRRRVTRVSTSAAVIAVVVGGFLSQQDRPAVDDIRIGPAATTSPTSTAATTTSPESTVTTALPPAAPLHPRTSSIDTADSAGHEPVILPGSDGSISVIYGRHAEGGGFAVKLARCQDSTCAEPSVLELTDGSNGSWDIQADLLPDGSPVVAFTEMLSQPIERTVVLSCGDIDCSSWVRTEFAGWQLSGVSVGLAGTPMIGMWQVDGDHTNMKVVECGDRSCGGANTETIYHETPVPPPALQEIDGLGRLVSAAQDYIVGCTDRACSDTWTLSMLPPGTPEQSGPDQLAARVLDLAMGITGNPVVLATIGTMDTSGFLADSRLMIIECLDRNCRLFWSINVQPVAVSIPLSLTWVRPATFVLPQADGSILVLNAVTRAEGVDMVGVVELIRCLDGHCSNSDPLEFGQPSLLTEPRLHASLLDDGSLAMAYATTDSKPCVGEPDEEPELCGDCDAPDSASVTGLSLTIWPDPFGLLASQP